MANTKLLADGTSVTIWWALPNYAVNPAKPTAAEINASVNVTCSVAWANFAFGNQASNLISDPAMCDVGNVQTRGFAQFGGTISFFYPYNYTDTSNGHLTTFLALDDQYTLGYLIIRVDGKKTTAGVADKDKPAVTGDFVSIYKVISDGWSDVNTGEESFKYTITFQPQGDLWVNSYVGTPTVVTPVAIGTTAYTVGGKTPLGTYLTGRQLAASAGFINGYPSWFNWTSSNPAIASVDKNGVVTGVAIGGPVNIIATHPASGVASTALAVTIV